MGEKVWVIESGEYSDYRVVGVFSSKKNADMINELLNAGESYDKGEVAEWDLDPGVAQLMKGYTTFLGEMRKDGTVERCIPWRMEISPSLGIWRRSTAPAYRGKNIEDCLHGTVLAKNQKHAIKIMNERRTQLIATGEWDGSAPSSARREG